MSSVFRILTNPGFFITKINFFLFLSLISCNGDKVSNGHSYNKSKGSLISYAERLDLDRRSDYLEVTIINPWQGAAGIKNQYYLIRKGMKIPTGIDSTDVIFVPLEKIICMSTTHLAMISSLHEEHTVAGVSGSEFIYEKTLSERVNKGLIKEIGFEANLNKELILSISPDLIMMYGIGSESVGYINKIRELGIKTIFNADYLENDPLGKAEWIKLFGALYCKEDIADSIFKSVSDDYNKTKLLINNSIEERPDVMLGLPFKDTWFISPGNSYICKIISDAGGNYLWKDTESSVSMPFGIENVYLKALDADFWLNTGSANTKGEIISFDPRLAEIPCFKNGNLFNNNNRINSFGGNDYWESGSLNPHILLKDMASILHPDLFNTYQLFYYKKVN